MHPLVQSRASPADSERGALQDRPPHEVLSAGGEQQVRDRVGPRRLAEHRDDVGVAAEPADVGMHPAQRLEEVEEAEVRRAAL